MIKNYVRLFLLCVLPLLSFAQCPTDNLPFTNTIGNFEIEYNGIKYPSTANNDKMSFCTNSNFKVIDKSGQTDVFYYFGISQSAFPVPMNKYVKGINVDYTTSMSPGQYFLIQLNYDAGSNTIKSYACKPIEVVAPIKGPKVLIRTCVSRQVEIDIPIDSQNLFDSYSINWGDGSPTEIIQKNQLPISARKHLYSNINPRAVTISGKKSDILCGGISTISITPDGRVTKPTLLSLAVQESDSVLVKYIGANYNLGVFQQSAAGNFINIKTFNSSQAGINTLLLPVMNVNDKQYCYKLGNLDGCSKVSYSDSICTIPLQVFPLDKKNVLKWNTIRHPQFSSYKISKNGNFNYANLNDIKSDKFIDQPVLCGNSYDYQITAYAGAIQSLSRKITVIGVDSTKPPAIDNVLVSIKNEKVDVIASNPSSNSFQKFIFYHLRNNKFEAFYSGKSRFVTDNESQPNIQQEYYKVAYINDCSIHSDTSDAYCPIFLKPKENFIQWTAYQNFVSGLDSYYIEEIDADDVVQSSQKVGNNLRFEPQIGQFENTELRYRIKAVAFNDSISYSNVIEYVQKSLLFYPQAFSPNNDNLNDTFKVYGVFVKDYNLQIYNRTGNVIFETNDIKNEWDGKYDGKVVPKGEYLFKIIVTDFSENTISKAGSILVM